MEPTSFGAVIVAAGALVLLMAFALWCWNRARGMFRWPLRVTALLGCQVGAVALAALVLNGQYDFYGSWSELVGRAPQVSASAGPVRQEDNQLRGLLARAAARGRGTLVPLAIPGTASGLRALPATIYLPPQYGEASYAHRDFPVIELLGGYPGGPQTWTGILHIASTLDAEIRAGRTQPMIAVMPTMNVASPRDTECVNVPGGPQASTYLTADVRKAVTTAFRAETGGSGWAVMGYSTGGYCSSMLTSEYPDMFAAAASLEGYNAASIDKTTGSLFHGNVLLAHQHDLLWRVRHSLVPDVPMLFIATKQDRQSYRDSSRLAAAAPAHLRFWQLTLPRGAHNKGTFLAEIPLGLSWVSHRLGPALEPAPHVDGLAPVRMHPPGKGLGAPALHTLVRQPVAPRHTRLPRPGKHAQSKSPAPLASAPLASAPMTSAP